MTPITAKQRAVEVFNANLDMIPVDQTLFRRTVMQTLVTEFMISNATAATHYNNAKKLAEKNGAVSGLGRVAAMRDRSKDTIIPESECFTITEVIDNIVTRTQSFVSEQSAREKLAERRKAKVPTDWKLISGLGPNVGDTYKLSVGEVELV